MKIAKVLLSAAFGVSLGFPVLGLADDGKPVDMATLMSTLSEPQKALKAINDKSAEADKAADDAKKEANKANERRIAIENQIADLRLLPASSSNAEQIIVLQGQRNSQVKTATDLTMAFKAKMDASIEAKAKVEAYVRENPTVTLPDWATKTPDGKQHPIPNHTLPGKGHAHKQGDLINGGADWDGRKTSNSGVVVAPGNNKFDAFPKNNSNNLRDAVSDKIRIERDALAEKQRKEREFNESIRRMEQQALDLEASAIKEEVSKRDSRFASFKFQIEDLRGRIERHNLNKPDPYNHAAVNAYNAERDRLETERGNLIRTANGIDADAAALASRGREFEKKVAAYRAKWPNDIQR